MRRRRGCSTASGIGGRLANGHAVRLDDPLAVGRFTAEEVELWRDAGIYYLVPCVSNDRVNAVFALGRRETGEPLTSEDMDLLTAVAGQAATAIENGRLYRQLHLKASELDRLARLQREHPRIARRWPARRRA